MSNETESYLAHRAMREADTLYGTVLSLNDNGTYQVERATDKVVITASIANPFDAFVSGTWVVLNYLGASGLSSGAGYVIVSRAPAEQRGLAGSVPNVDSEEHMALVVTELVPNPIILVQGGASAGAVAHGHGFLSGPLPYANGITDSSAPIVSPDSLSLHLQASSLAAIGLSDLKFDALTVFPKAIKVIPGTWPAHSLWLMGYDSSYSVAKVIRINAADMSVYATYPDIDETTTYNALTYITKKGSVIYAKVGGQFLRFAAGPGTALAPIACADSQDDSLSLADVGSLIFYGDFSTTPFHLRMFDATPDTEGGFVVTLPTDPTYSGSTAIDFTGATLWIGTPEWLIKWDLSSGTVADQFPGGLGDDYIYGAFRGDGVIYVTRGGSIERRDVTSGAVLNSTAIPNIDTRLELILGHIYFTTTGGGNNHLVKCDPDTLAVLGFVDIGFPPNDFRYSGGIFYVCDYSGGVSRVDAATMTVIDRTVYLEDCRAITYA